MQIYFRFNCDKKDRIKLIPSDMYFDLHEFDLVIEYKHKLDSLGYDYDFLIEEYDQHNHNIESSNYIVMKNYLNNL